MIKIEEYDPVGAMILIEMDQVDEKTESGLIIKPEITIDKDEVLETRGTVRKVGKSAWEEYPEPWAKVGDKVLVRRNAGQMFRSGDKVFRIMLDENVMAVLND